MVVVVLLVGVDGRPLGQVQLEALEGQIVVGRACFEEELHRLAALGRHDHMNPQTVEEALLGGDVAPKLFALVESATPDTDVVAHGDGEAIDHVLPRVIGLLEDGGKDGEEGLPARGVDGMQSAVEPALGYHVWHVAVLVEEEASLVDVRAEGGGGCEGHRHHLGGGEASLRIVVVTGGLQEIVAQAIDGGYGIFQVVLPVREGWVAFEPGGYCLSG
jgi:hypothetical protein